jgi:hypothetical protein
MPNVILKVTLIDGSLDVDQSGNANQIAHGKSVTIEWQLTGNAAQGSFNSMSPPNPGFAWKHNRSNPPAGVFGTASPQGSKMTMTDNNTDPNGVSSAGTWIYQLWATIDGRQYSTIDSNSDPIGVATNPTIQNK